MSPPQNVKRGDIFKIFLLDKSRFVRNFGIVKMVDGNLGICIQLESMYVYELYALYSIIKNGYHPRDKSHTHQRLRSLTPRNTE